MSEGMLVDCVPYQVRGVWVSPLAKVAHRIFPRQRRKRRCAHRMEKGMWRIGVVVVAGLMGGALNFGQLRGG